MTEIKLYKCAVCGEEFEDKDECEKHEYEHSLCPCKKQRYERFLHKVIGYGRTLRSGIDFKEAEIYVYYSPECDIDTHYSMPIKYCPLCGERLSNE